MQKKTLQKKLGLFPSKWDSKRLWLPRVTKAEADVLPEEMTDLAKYVPDPYPDQGGVGSCFPTETPILMEDFTYKPIGQVNVGEYVITCNARPRRVTKKFKRVWQGNTFHIKVYGVPDEVEVTGEHPFLTVDGWKKAEELTKKDFIAIPQLNTLCNDKTLHQIERDPDFLWLLGLYLAEGSLDYLRVVFSLSSEEIDLADRVVMIGKKLGFVTHSHPHEPHGLTVTITGGEWVALFDELCGEYCSQKRLHPRLMFLNSDLQKNIFDGWRDGDGHHINEVNDVVVTTSEYLVWQMYHILLRNGIRGSIQKRKERDDRLSTWVLDVSYSERTPSSSARGFFRDGFFYSRVRSVKAEPYLRQNVYNLEVEEDNTYIVRSLVVHNCVGWAWSEWNWISHRLQDKVPEHELFSAWDAYSKARKYDDLPDIIGEGSTNLGGAKALQKEGICFESCLPTPKEPPTVEPTPCEDYESYGISQYFQINRQPADLKAAICGKVNLPDWGGASPIVIGIQVYESFRNVGEDGIVPVPKAGEQMLGGHALEGSVYKKIDGFTHLGGLNSWGEEWGDKGWYWLPFDETNITNSYQPYLMDAWVGHAEPVIIPAPDEPSDCQVAIGYVNFGNWVAETLGRKSRIPAPIVKN